jgi:hypothetical protein
VEEEEQKEETKYIERIETVETAEHYERIVRYLRWKAKIAVEEEDIEVASEAYVLKEDGKLFTKNNRAVIFNEEETQLVIELIHKDLGYYGKEVTKDGVKKWYIVARDFWEKGEKVLDSCVPCQLHKRPKKTTETAVIHLYGVKDPFVLWEIDFVGPLNLTHAGNLFLIIAIDYAISKAFAYPLMERSAEAAAELLQEIIWTCGRPTEIVIDNGVEFISDKFQAVRRRYGIYHNKTTPGHP